MRHNVAGSKMTSANRGISSPPPCRQGVAFHFRTTMAFVGMVLCLGLLSGCLGQQLQLLSDRFGTSFDFAQESGPDLVIIDLRLCKSMGSQQCGPAALATVFAYYEELADVDATRRIEQLSALREGPWTLGEMEALSRENGYPAVTATADLAQVREWVDKGWPPMVALRGSDSAGHVCVLVGYHRTKGYVVLADPQMGFRKYSDARFMRRWELTGRACVLVMPKSKRPDA